MEKVKIHFQMAISGENETKFTTDGTLFGSKLFFTDDQNFRYVVEYSQNQVRIERHGQTSMKLILINEETSYGEFTSQGLSFPFAVKTKQILLTDQELSLSYDMLENEQVLTHHEMKLKWILHGRN